MPYPNIVPTEYFTSSHSQVGCNKFSFWVTPHISHDDAVLADMDRVLDLNRGIVREAA